MNPSGTAADFGPDEFHETGRALGHDIFCLTLWPIDPTWHASVREGFEYAHARRFQRHDPDYVTRKWLQLRLNALARSRYVSPLVTREFLARIEVAECPVLRIPMTHGELKGTDASIDRLNNDGAYAPGNLAVMSTVANKAKSDRSFEEVHSLALQTSATGGLEPVQWLRVAALMLGPCFVSCPELAPDLPMPVPIPPGTARLPTQQVQCAFASAAGRPAGKNFLIKRFKSACLDERSLFRLKAFAEITHVHLKGLECVWDVWLMPAPMEALLAWRQSLDPRAWAAVGEISARLLGGQLLGRSGLNEWQLAQHGYRR